MGLQINMKLKDIATVSSGFTFRDRLEPNTTGNIRVIQMKDLNDENKVNINSLTRIEHSPPKQALLAKQGDLLFRSRGLTHTAALLTDESEDIVVAAPLLKIRADQSRVLPEYLLWFINQPSSQAYFSKYSGGTLVKMISKTILEDLEITLPALEKQKLIAEIFQLANQESRLLKKLREKRALYTQGVLQGILA